MRTVSGGSYSENQHAHFMFNNVPPPTKKNRAVCEIMWKNMVEAQSTFHIIWRYASHAGKQSKKYRHKLIILILIAFPR